MKKKSQEVEKLLKSLASDFRLMAHNFKTPEPNLKS